MGKFFAEYPHIQEETVSSDTLDIKIEEMTEKKEHMWKCKVCGKTMTKKRDLVRHVEIHIEGVSHACHICEAIFSTRNNLRSHISSIHSQMICDICAKSGMNGRAYKKHKQSCYKVNGWD